MVRLIIALFVFEKLKVVSLPYTCTHPAPRPVREATITPTGTAADLAAHLAPSHMKSRRERDRIRPAPSTAMYTPFQP